ncbi:MAG: dihydrolipoyl dehydrogenase family protein [Egibacteraceae bacterium]
MVEVDVAVIGGGAAGLSAALNARRKNASVALIERARLGGDCTWTGCVPSKALIERANAAQAARRLGLSVELDFAAIMEEVRAAIRTIAEDESRPVLEAAGITVLEGQAAFVGPGHLNVEGTDVRTDVVILATGATAMVPPIDGLREASPLTNDTVFDLRERPHRLAVLGGGPIGLELAQAFQRLGSQVTTFEGEDRLLPREEREASEVVRTVVEAEGMQVVLGSLVERVEQGEDGLTLRTEDGRSATADAILCALGRRPVTDGLELERAGVELDDRSFVQVDEHLETTAPGVYAVGDIAGDLQFTHAGYDMGGLAVGNALGRGNSSWSTRALPWATFTEPEVGRVGLTEPEAYEQQGEQAQVAFLPMAETDRGRLSGHTEGFVKLIAGSRQLLRSAGGGELLGATVVCPTGGELVHEAALLMRTHGFTGRLAQTVHAYPSWAMTLRQTAAQFFREEGGRRARAARPE